MERSVLEGKKKILEKLGYSSCLRGIKERWKVITWRCKLCKDNFGGDIYGYNRVTETMRGVERFKGREYEAFGSFKCKKCKSLSWLIKIKNGPYCISLEYKYKEGKLIFVGKPPLEFKCYKTLKEVKCPVCGSDDFEAFDGFKEKCPACNSDLIPTSGLF